MRKIVVIIVLVLMSLPALTFAGEVGIGDIIFFCNVSEGRYLRVRDGPSLDAAEIWALNRGDVVRVSSARLDRGWLQLQLVWGEPGWVWFEYLSTTPPGAKEAVIDASGRVRLRDAPNGDVKRYLQPGQLVTVTRTVEAAGSLWALVSVAGKVIGWVDNTCIAYVHYEQWDFD